MPTRMGKVIAFRCPYWVIESADDQESEVFHLLPGHCFPGIRESMLVRLVYNTGASFGLWFADMPLMRNMVRQSLNGTPCVDHWGAWTGEVPCTGVFACTKCGLDMTARLGGK